MVLLDLKKALRTKNFYLAILFICIILMLSSVYENETGKSFNALTGLTLGEDIINSNPNKLSYQAVVTNYNIKGDLVVYGSMITLIPLVNILIGERRKGAIRFQLFRTSKTGYALGKLLVTFLTGGFIVIGGFLLFNIYAKIAYPDISTYSYGYEMVKAVDYKLFLELFFYGCVTAVAGYFFSAFISNIYLVYCIPFIINYLYLLIMNNLLSNHFVYGTKAFFIGFACSSFKILDMFEMETSYSVGIAVIQIIFVFTVFGMYRLILEKKTDCGE